MEVTSSLGIVLNEDSDSVAASLLDGARVQRGKSDSINRSPVEEAPARLISWLVSKLWTTAGHFTQRGGEQGIGVVVGRKCQRISWRRD